MPNPTIAERLAALEKRMRTDRTGWNADDKAQARYMRLVEARDKMAGNDQGGEQG